MRICVVGAGYVGLVTAAVLADLGHQIVVVENDQRRLASLQNGKIPFTEKGLAPLVRECCRAGRLYFTADLAVAAPADLVFIAVGTPPLPDGRPDLSALHKVTAALTHLPARTVVIKSTVPVGTGDQLEKDLRLNGRGKTGQGKAEQGKAWRVLSNPEFLRPGSALDDFRYPDRIVIGAAEEEAAHLLVKLYTPLNRPLLVTDRCSAEMTKYAANAYLAAKISFINEIANLCESSGADIATVSQGIGMDRRIGQAFLKAGVGFGGSCLPKDLDALLALGQDFGLPLPLLRATVTVNREQRFFLARRLKELLGSLAQTRIACWGLTYKPGVDEIRGAPALDLLAYLLGEGADVRVYDPQKRARTQIGTVLPGVVTCNTAQRAARGADAILLLTEWPEFARVNWKKLLHVVNRPLVLDGRNFLDGTAVQAAGFHYVGLGQARYRLKQALEKTTAWRDRAATRTVI